MPNSGGKDPGFCSQNKVQSKAQVEILLNRILHLAAPFYSCYVQCFLVKKKVLSYKTLDIKGMGPRTKSQDSILEVWSFKNNILKFQSQTQRSLPPEFSLKFSYQT